MGNLNISRPQPLVGKKAPEPKNYLGIGSLEKFFVGVATTWLFAPYFIAAVTISTVAGVGWGNRLAQPLLIGATFWPVLIFGLREKGFLPTFGRLVFGYALLCVAMTVVASWLPLNANLSVWRGESYLERSLTWIYSGGGLFSFSRHDFGMEILELVVLVALSAQTAGLAGIIMLAGEVNIIGYRAAMLYAQSDQPMMTLAMAWPPWWIVKTVSYAMLAMALSEPLMRRMFGIKSDQVFHKKYLLASLVGIALSLILYAALSGLWRSALANSLIQQAF